jgi:hypothetical protein
MRSPEVVIVPMLFIMLGFIVWVVVNGFQRRLHLKLATDFNSRLLERIGSVKDFSDFLQTEGGTKFLDSLTVERAAAHPQNGILRAVQIGIVLLMLGVGLLGLAWYFTARSTNFDDYEGLTITGVIALSLGVGFVLSSAASYRLARTLGVLDRDRHHGGALSS